MWRTPSVVRIPALCLLWLLLASAAFADEEVLTAGRFTERGRRLDRILDMILVPRSKPPAEGRAVTLLIDATPSLQAADFAVEVREALRRNASRLSTTRVGVARVGREGKPLLAPTRQFELVVQSVTEICTKPESVFQNVYADVRRVLPALKREKGVRELVLVTLENGDAEDDIEQTVSALERAKVRFSVVTREAYLSDCFYAQRPPRGPPGTRFTGSDGAFIELPWGVRFQWTSPNVHILSGFAVFGLTRLAAVTDGRIYLFYPSTGQGHTCCLHPYCRCPFCVGDHAPPKSAYRTHRLRAVAPVVESRSAATKHAMKDPYYRAVHRAWKRATQDGLVHSLPSLKSVGGGWQIERRTYRGWMSIGGSTAFEREAGRALRLIHDCTRILDDLQEDIARGREKGGGGYERYLAMAETTRLYLHITRVNLLLFVAFCEEVAPEIVTRRQSSYPPPEYGPYPDDMDFRGIGYHNLSLCHGVKPYQGLRLPGGDDMKRELRELTAEFDAFSRRWEHTPFYQAVHGLGLARFWLVKDPGYRPPGQRRRPDRDEEEEIATLPTRPKRPGRPSGTSGGTGGGTTTGGR